MGNYERFSPGFAGNAVQIDCEIHEDPPRPALLTQLNTKAHSVKEVILMLRNPDPNGPDILVKTISGETGDVWQFETDQEGNIYDICSNDFVALDDSDLVGFVKLLGAREAEIVGVLPCRTVKTLLLMQNNRIYRSDVKKYRIPNELVKRLVHPCLN
jgi:hypothetical protein